MLHRNNQSIKQNFCFIIISYASFTAKKNVIDTPIIIQDQEFFLIIELL